MVASTISGSYLSTSDTSSPVFPGRPIRPLPKRPLRNRLSSDIANASNVHNASSQAEVCRDGSENCTEENSPARQVDTDYVKAQQNRRLYDIPVGPSNEWHNNRPPVFVRPDKELSPVADVPLDPYSREILAKHADIASLDSLLSPADGYDAFENTNNKKKRKIPTSGGISLIGASEADASLAASAAIIDELEAFSFYNADVAPSETIPRYRSGRHGSRPSSGKSSHAIQSCSPYPSQRGLPSDSMGLDIGPSTSENGMISSAIVSAASISSLAQNPQNPQDDSNNQEENLSSQALQQRRALRKAQFTFTCQTDLDKQIPWSSHHMDAQLPASLPESGTMPMHPSSVGPEMKEASCPSPFAEPQNSAAQQERQRNPNANPPEQQMPSAHNAAPPPPPSHPSKPRRPASELYELAAKHRRLQQQYTNLHHPPSPSEIWICEFCEYESIFGTPPLALIRQYEKKDRIERRRLREKRRLLEKAHRRGRAARKGTRGKHADAHRDDYDHERHGPEHPEGYDGGYHHNCDCGVYHGLEHEYDHNHPHDCRNECYGNLEPASGAHNEYCRYRYSQEHPAAHQQIPPAIPQDRNQPIFGETTNDGAVG